MSSSSARQQQQKHRAAIIERIRKLESESDALLLGGSSGSNQQQQQHRRRRPSDDTLANASANTLKEYVAFLKRRRADAKMLLYSSDWIVIITSLAAIARRNPTVCVAGADLNNVSPVDTGLKWSVVPDAEPMLLNKPVFQTTFFNCLRMAAAAASSSNGGIRYIAGLITLVSFTESHVLSYLYTIATREFEVFDPNGGLQFAIGNNDFKKQKYFSFDEFSIALQHYLCYELRVASQVFMPIDWCPDMNVQRIDESSPAAVRAAAEHNSSARKADFGGYCGAWSIWWLNHRLNKSSTRGGGGGSRKDLLRQAVERFENSGVDVRAWMLQYAQKLTRDTVVVMRLALRQGGRTAEEADTMVAAYAYEKTQRQIWENEQRRGGGGGIGGSSSGGSDAAILNEVVANIGAALTIFSNGRFISVHNSSSSSSNM